MNIYDKNGYIDIRKIMALNMPFTFIIGGRGTGKTYTTLKTLIEDDIRFLLMRRTQTQLDIITRKEFSPFKKLNNDNGWSIEPFPITKNNSGYYQTEERDGKNVPSGLPVGYGVALSTISNIRGFDASDVSVMVYDEFIPEKHERPIKGEGTALLNAYETINRNRELEGKDPLKLLALANSNDISNPIFLELKLVRKAKEMEKKEQEVCIIPERGICLVMLYKSPISEEKENTALYKMAKDTTFSKMALENNFSSNEFSRIKSKPIKEYCPIVSVGEITIYRHKSKNEYYVSTHKNGSPPTYGAGDTELARFKRAYLWLWGEYMKDNIIFEENLCEILLDKYFK